MKKARFTEEQIIGLLREHSLFGKAPRANRRHARSGDVAQWKREFTPELARAFLDCFPDALEMLGYEKDDRWVDSLTPPARLEAQVHTAT